MTIRWPNTIKSDQSNLVSLVVLIAVTLMENQLKKCRIHIDVHRFEFTGLKIAAFIAIQGQVTKLLELNFVKRNLLRLLRCSGWVESEKFNLLADL